MDTAALTPELVELLRAHRTLVLASTGGPVSPWIAAAYFAEADPFTLQLAIETGGKTMANLRADPRIAVMVAGPHPFALFAQGEGLVTIERPGTAAHARIRAELIAKAPEMEPFFAAPMEHLRLRLRRWLLTDVTRGWLPARERATPRC